MAHYDDRQWYEVGDASQPLDKARFKAWLETFGTNDKVGDCKRTMSCTLARFMCDQFFSGVRIGFATCWHYDKRGLSYPNVCFELPEWAKDFVARHDLVERTYITAGEALDILSRIA